MLGRNNTLVLVKKINIAEMRQIFSDNAVIIS